MGGINRGKVDSVIQSFNEWVESVDTHLADLPSQVTTIVADSVGYGSELNSFVERVQQTVQTELSERLKATVTVLEQATQDISQVHASQAADVAAKTINFETR